MVRTLRTARPLTVPGNDESWVGSEGHSKDVGGTAPPYSSAMTNADDQTIEAVRLARDLCMGLGAFVVSTRGDVRFELAAPGPSGIGERVAVLARSCLERP